MPDKSVELIQKPGGIAVNSVAQLRAPVHLATFPRFSPDPAFQAQSFSVSGT
jgi:hypothetical protein